MNQFKFVHPGILVCCCLLLALISFTACGNVEDQPEPGTKNTNPVVEPDYILFNGYKMILRKPRLWKIGVNAGDTVMNWAGSTGGSGDTAIQFRHPEGIKAGTNTVVKDALNLGEVGIFINWGVPGVYPEVQLTSGDYKIERVNKRWVSTLKNGKGIWEKSGGNVNYTGIEVRVTWPEF